MSIMLPIAGDDTVQSAYIIDQSHVNHVPLHVDLSVDTLGQLIELVQYPLMHVILIAQILLGDMIQHVRIKRLFKYCDR